MRAWLPPLVLGFVLAVVAYTLMMVQIPRMLMGFATGRISQLAGYNAMTATPLATDKARAIVRPSPDLAYSSCPYDVAKGPVLVDIEPVPSRYWSLSVFDARTDVKFVRNNLDAEGKPIRIAIALAGQPVPDGMQAVRVDDPTGIALLRILVEDGNQFPAIDAARKLSSCKPLS